MFWTKAVEISAKRAIRAINRLGCVANKGRFVERIEVFTEKISSFGGKITIYAAKIAFHALKITSRALKITSRALKITSRARKITSRARKITSRARKITSHARKITSHAPKITSHALKIAPHAAKIQLFHRNDSKDSIGLVPGAAAHGGQALPDRGHAFLRLAPVQNLDPVVYNCETATEVIMSTTADRLASEIRDLPDAEKLRLVDAILTDLDKPDPEIDRIWAEEARKRWAAYKAGEIPTVAYEDVMAKYTRE